LEPPRCPAAATSVGVRIRDGEMEVCAPFGLDDLTTGIGRPNMAMVSAAIYIAKVARWQACWPGLTVLPWGAGAEMKTVGAAAPDHY